MSLPDLGMGWDANVEGAGVRMECDERFVETDEGMCVGVLTLEECLFGAEQSGGEFLELTCRVAFQLFHFCDVEQARMEIGGDPGDFFHVHTNGPDLSGNGDGSRCSG